jgi:hypothetical protein
MMRWREAAGATAFGSGEGCAVVAGGPKFVDSGDPKFVNGGGVPVVREVAMATGGGSSHKRGVLGWTTMSHERKIRGGDVSLTRVQRQQAERQEGIGGPSDDYGGGGGQQLPMARCGGGEHQSRKHGRARAGGGVWVL